MNVEEMTIEEIKIHLAQRDAENIRSLDQEINAMRGTLRELERKRAEITGDKIPEAPKAPKPKAPNATIKQIEDATMSVLVDGPRSVTEITQATGLTVAQVKRGLGNLEKGGAVVRIGERRGTKYSVSPGYSA